MLTVGRAALEAHDRDAARDAIAPLIASDSPHGRPTRRVCLLMADIEEADGHQGAVREWLGRAARAPRDKAWVADGVISDRWAPVSPSGALDAFVWRTPDERIAAIESPAGRSGAGRRAVPPISLPPSPSAPSPSSADRAPEPPRRVAPSPASRSPRPAVHHRPGDHGAGRPRAGRRGAERSATSASSRANEPRNPRTGTERCRLPRSSSSAPAMPAFRPPPACARVDSTANRSAFDEKDLPYQRPPLSKAFLKGEMDMHGLPLRAEAFFRDHRIDLRLGVRAETDRPGGEARRDERRTGARLRPSDPGDRSAATPPRGARRRTARRLRPAHDRRRDRDPRAARPRSERSS